MPSQIRVFYIITLFFISLVLVLFGDRFVPLSGREPADEAFYRDFWQDDDAINHKS